MARPRKIRRVRKCAICGQAFLPLLDNEFETALASHRKEKRHHRAITRLLAGIPEAQGAPAAGVAGVKSAARKSILNAPSH